MLDLNNPDDPNEGQHEDQNEEDAQGPKRTNREIQPPQLRARLKSDDDPNAPPKETTAERNQITPQTNKATNMLEQMVIDGFNKNNGALTERLPSRQA